MLSKVPVRPQTHPTNGWCGGDERRWSLLLSVIIHVFAHLPLNLCLSLSPRFILGRTWVRQSPNWQLKFPRSIHSAEQRGRSHD